MTPDQHREQAALLRLSEDDESHRRAELHEKLAAGIEKRSAAAVAMDAAGWNEADHPRGQPGNKGQFGPGGGGSTTPAPKAQAAAPARRTGRTGAYAGQYETRGATPIENHALTVSRVLANPPNRGIHYRRMLAQLIREAPGFNGASAVNRLRQKLSDALVMSYASLQAAGRTDEAQRALTQSQRLLAQNAAMAPRDRPPTPAQRPAMRTRPLAISPTPPPGARPPVPQPAPGSHQGSATAQKLKDKYNGNDLTPAVYERHVKKDPDQFMADMLGPLGKVAKMQAIQTSRYATGTGSQQLFVSANFEGGGSIRRTFDFENGTVDHDYLVIPKELRNSGKEILAGQIKTYQDLGMKRVKVHANIDVGAYAWAKYGFVPSVGSWNDLRRGLKLRTEAIRKGLTGGAYSSPDKDKAVEALRQIDTLLDNPEPKTLWKVVDHPGSVTVGGKETTIAKVMMTGATAPHWYGALDLTDKETMGRFNGHVGKKS